MKFSISDKYFFNNRKLLISLFLTLYTLWMLLIYSDFLIKPYYPGFSSDLFRIFTKSVCHSDPNKLITFSGSSTLVCSRCTGIYTGIYIASFLLLIFKPYKFVREHYFRIFWIITLLMIFDVFADDLRLYQYSHIFSLCIGIMWGVTVQFIIFADI